MKTSLISELGAFKCIKDIKAIELFKCLVTFNTATPQYCITQFLWLTLLSSQIAIRNQQLALKKRQSATYKWQFTVNYLRTSGERTLIAEFVHFIRTGGETRRLLGDVRSGS